MIGAVVPIYNRRDNLALLLTSLERQSYAGFHVVVADDGSTDGSRELVEGRDRWAAWDGRLRWVCCGPNRGTRTDYGHSMALAIGGSLFLASPGRADSDIVGTSLRPPILKCWRPRWTAVSPMAHQPVPERKSGTAQHRAWQ